MPSPVAWPRFEEPLSHTLRRNLAIALGVGAATAMKNGEHRLIAPVALLALWFSLGGHYVEVAFLNGLRRHLPRQRAMQVTARLALWFVGGVLLFLCMAVTSRLLPVRPLHFEACWWGGLLLIGVELLVHGTLVLRRLPNFYDGRG